MEDNLLMETNNRQEEQLRWKACGICHIGKIRGNNEDNLLFSGRIREELTMPVWEGNFANGGKDSIFAVMDGMGGESHGEWAALVTAQTLQQLAPLSIENIFTSIQQINLKICDKIQSSAARRIGTTVVIAKIQNNQVDFINLGDSRGYLWHKETLTQCSNDHTEYQSQLNMGFTVEDLKRRRVSQGALTQHLGIFPDELILEPYLASTQVVAGDKLLLCSDGLTGMVTDEEMTVIFQKELSPKETAHQLLELALQHGGKDNITIEVVGFYVDKGEE